MIRLVRTAFRRDGLRAAVKTLVREKAWNSLERREARTRRPVLDRPHPVDAMPDDPFAETLTKS